MIRLVMPEFSCAYFLKTESMYQLEKIL